MISNNKTFRVSCCFKKTEKKQNQVKNYENYGFKRERAKRKNLKHKNNFDSVKAFVGNGERSLD